MCSNSLPRVVGYCGPFYGFYVISRRPSFTWSWGNKTEITKITENYGFKQTQKFLLCPTQCHTKNFMKKKKNGFSLSIFDACVSYQSPIAVPFFEQERISIAVNRGSTFLPHRWQYRCTYLTCTNSGHSCFFEKLHGNRPSRLSFYLGHLHRT